MAVDYHNDDIVIVDAARSIIGSGSGTIKDIPAVNLGAHVMNGMLARCEKQSSGFSRSLVQHFACGLSIGAGLGQNPPRQITQQCGIDNIASAYVINEMCGSGMEAIINGIRPLRLGEYEFSMVGGVEAVAAAPYLITTQELISWQDKRVEEIQTLVKKADLYDGLWDKIADVHTIVHAENTTQAWVDQHNLDPEAFKLAIDDYALLSHERARAAINDGMFQDEIIAMPETSENDECPARKNIKIMNKRKGTQFTPDGIFLSNHNSPPLANGAAFMLLCSYKNAKKYGLEPLAKIVAYANAGTAPADFLLAPLGAVKRLLTNTNTKISDYDLIESNSAFGSQMLFNQQELGLDMDRVNIYGDCIALGHPVGAAGCRILTTLLYGLIRRQSHLGLATICLGGGNGIAMSIER